MLWDIEHRGTGTLSLDYWRPVPSHSVRLFCFHHAGGSALAFRNWHSSMPESIEVCPLQLPGRGRQSHESPLTSLEAISERAAAAVIRLLDGSFALFGFSMGAYVAFETARRIEERGFTPRAVFVAGAAAPHVRVSDPDVWRLPRHELMAKLRSINATPQPVMENSELMDMFLPIIRADFQAVESYRPAADATVRCPLVALGATGDREASPAQVAAWAAWSSGGCRCEWFTGDHSFALGSSRDVARRTAQCLETL